MLSSRDSLQTVINKLHELILVKFIKLTKAAKAGVIRLLKEMANNSITSHVLLNLLLRQIVGGDTSPENLLLIESVLDICIEHRAWLEKNQESLQFAFFRFLRLIQVYLN